MNFNILLFLPEFFQIIIILVLFFQSIAQPNIVMSRLFLGNQIGWVPIAGLISIILSLFSLAVNGTMFWGSYQVDGMSQFFKFIITVGFTITTLNAVKQPTIKLDQRVDYFMFLAISVMGLMILSSSVELMTIYLALEISSYSLYAIIPIRNRDIRAAEAGIKYILFGAVATAIALYGLSYILASQHSSYLSVLSQKDWSWIETPIGTIGLSLFMVGFFYKLALFPFHFWCPDVYDGTSNETAAYIATLPKLGAVIILIRLISILKPWSEVTSLLAVLAAVSITFGNMGALIQKDIKRIMGYSSISHAGYIMVGLVAGSSEGLAAASFYSLIYLFMNLTVFWVICRLSTDGRNLELRDLNGLYYRAPFMAFVLAVAVFALVGLPPTAGFLGKFFLLTAAWDRGYNWLIIVAALNTAISIYYYLNIIRHVYTIDYYITKTESVISLSLQSKGVAGFLVILLLMLGVIPNPFFKWAEIAGRQLLP